MDGTVISDMHIKGPREDSYRLLLDYFGLKEVQKSDHWYFLGDIFDLMIGHYTEYPKIFPEFFTYLASFLARGGTIHYLEGNHDFHVEGVFLDFFQSRGVNSKKFFYHSGPFTQKIGGKQIVFSHGDDIQKGNWDYRLLKGFLRNNLTELLINKVISYGLLKKIGQWMSTNSRQKNQQKYGNGSGMDRVKKRFRFFSREFFKENRAEILICGHSHVLDDYTFNQYRYLNLGFPPQNKKFLLIRGEKIYFADL
jgi:UDP-2,3-diacylglucosamine hydrolase